MTKEKKKEKRAIPLRAAGEVIKSPERPSVTLFNQVIEQEKNESAIPPTTSYQSLQPSQKNELNVSPKRDYAKVANSIARDAVPAGLFKGTSKNTYDVLYLRTRGAINPSRTIKAVQQDVLLWTNVTHNTLRTHLKHLQAIGLIQIHYKLGDNNGATYEVFLPEEIDLDTTPYHPLPPPTSSYQKLVGGTYQKPLVGGGGFMPENIDANDALKTSFKDYSDDDEKNAAVSTFIEKFDAASRKLTGKGISKRETENWNDLADLIILELEIAARRTNSISSIPAFLTEVLRRQFFAARQLQVADKTSKTDKSSRTKTDTVGKSESDSYQIKPLDAKEREEALAQLREFAGDNFLMDFKKWYTAEDWEWIMGKIDKLESSEIQ